MNAEHYSGALEAVDRLVNRGGDADEVLSGVVRALHERGIAFVAIRFVEGDALVAGPSVGRPAAATEVPVVFAGKRVGTFAASVGDSSFVERVATLISPFVLVGWDTGGEPWEP